MGKYGVEHLGEKHWLAKLNHGVAAEIKRALFVPFVSSFHRATAYDV
jgi:hypothetical protein